ncbi:ABC transporter ATP-binding protein [Mesorhizobium sp.]|uniref:ABC transporter ATP-binding protein n=1 Tax=Mesorhizobium sp. TaxID=1871066 RepID=UPI000FE6AEEC|nr:ABC transporter ATP-binding protein [Mesorhizobium sp.]RWM24652.1 MAG: ABC transporter ATP-binding protein [Mesorhizobium sp.]TJV53481.1 MAG: ABC transporter ATP-binding protein [Mesorhizobium sp.]
MTAVLSVRNLRVEIPTRHGVLTAIDDLSFDIAPGEVLGVVGESGAGKSITGSAIIGLLDPPGRVAGGQILLSGERIDNLSPSAMRRIRGKRIGMIFQDPLTSLNPLYRIGDQLTETILTHEKMSARAALDKAEHLLVEVGIPAAKARLSSYPHQFSGGMRQRVVIALALAADPELVIADEPTTALDVSVQAQVISLLKRLCKDRGASVMLITHDMGVIAETADRVCVLYAGRLAEIGKVRDVVKLPQHPYTHGLMAAIPSLNGDPDARLEQIPGAMPRLDAIPQGCAFNPRCSFRFDRCPAERPAVYETSRSQASCFLLDAAGEAPPAEIAAAARAAGIKVRAGARTGADA